MNRKILSIIIPAYNEGAKINLLFENLIKQDRKDIEIIVINDGSTDNTAEIVETYKNSFYNYSFHTKVNGGAGSARNYGLSKAKGKFVYFHDADDILEENAINKICAVLGEKLNLSLLIFGYSKTTIVDYKIIDKYNVFLQNKSFSSNKEVIENFHELMNMKGRLSVWNKVFNTELIESNNILYPNRKRTQDMFFFVDYLKHTESCYIMSEVLYHHVAISDIKKLDPNLILNHLDLYERLRNTIGSHKNNYTFLAKIFCLWFGYIISNQIFNSNMNTVSERKSYLQALFNDERYDSFINELLKTKRVNFKYKIILRVLKQKSYTSYVWFAKLRNTLSIRSIKAIID